MSIFLHSVSTQCLRGSVLDSPNSCMFKTMVHKSKMISSMQSVFWNPIKCYIQQRWSPSFRRQYGKALLYFMGVFIVPWYLWKPFMINGTYLQGSWLVFRICDQRIVLFFFFPHVRIRPVTLAVLAWFSNKSNWLSYSPIGNSWKDVLILYYYKMKMCSSEVSLHS